MSWEVGVQVSCRSGQVPRQAEPLRPGEVEGVAEKRPGHGALQQDAIAWTPGSAAATVAGALHAGGKACAGIHVPVRASRVAAVAPGRAGTAVAAA
ncbi:MAG: hypothetical protein H6977_06310 [Gammaproteobacteria bacterium]|nr:hypothetical protein [Gammaproteobacteria bacterium]MCP5199604.1 hypothetical protein [Gammaproteobacteria bacterium]